MMDFAGFWPFLIWVLVAAGAIFSGIMANKVYDDNREWYRVKVFILGLISLVLGAAAFYWMFSSYIRVLNGGV